MVEPRSGPSQRRDLESPHTEAEFHGPARPRKEDYFAVVKVRFEIPPGGLYYRVSRDFPEVVAEATATHLLPDGRAMAELEVVGSQAQEAVKALSREPGVVSVSQLSTLGPTVRCQIIARAPPYVLLSSDLEVLVRYPRIIQNGAFTIEVASRVTQIEKLLEGLRRLYPAVQILRFGRDRMRTCPPMLTPNQDALLHLALAAGYFDVPRRITLTGLAEKLGKSKSSVSRGLAVVEQKLVEFVATTPR